MTSIRYLCTFLALGLVLTVFGSRKQRGWIAPGPLANPHAQLLTGHGVDATKRCAACHPGESLPETRPAGLLVSFTSNDGATGSEGTSVQSGAKAHTQSQLCMECHKNDLPEAIHGSPHDLTGDQLHQMLARFDPKVRPGTASWIHGGGHSPVAWRDNPTECSECHREHQGTMHTLQEMASDRCQACHKSRFNSFELDHPEFTDYPYDRPRRLAFDHSKHRDLHFTKKNAAFDCRTCHVSDQSVGAVGSVFRAVSFETACASCHAEPIKSALNDGVIVLQLPSISRQQFADAGVDIGPWPENASLLTDGVIPPLMRLLIESEPGGTELLAALPTSGKLSDLDPTSPTDGETVRKLTQTTRNLIRRMASDGQPGLRSRLVSLLDRNRVDRNRGSEQQDAPNSAALVSLQGNPATDEWLNSVVQGLPPDLFVAALRDWFGESEGNLPLASVMPKISPSTSSSISRSSLIQFSSSSRTVQNQDDDLLTGGSDDLLSNGSKPADKGDDLLAGAEDSLLGPEPGKKADDDLLSGSLDTPLNAASKTEPLKSIKAWDQLAYGGWMIDRQRMAIVYVPKGHGDQWLARWLEMDQCTEEVAASTGSKHKVQRLRDTTIAVQCRQCHLTHRDDFAFLSPSARPEGLYYVNAEMRSTNAARGEATANLNLPWQALSRSPKMRQITRFDHTPHLALPALRDCQSCHELRSFEEKDKPQFTRVVVGVENDRESMVGGRKLVHEFKPLQRAQCATCHTATAAGNSCTECHNYHVGKSGWAWDRACER